MQMLISSKWFPRLFTLVVWALLFASATYWVLGWGGSTSNIAAAAPLAPVGTDAQVLARVLGGNAQPASAAPAVSTASRLILTGVLAGSHSGAGTALISVDGKPAKPYAVGSKIDEGLYLASVVARKANLAASPNGETTFTLELPAPKPL